ncbi:hypothetical protein RAS1_03580 [Phycisphaerae bacterium RAS1]|nr:hypothetical protein RAS1_03580 [Phycisphaerae bacterium RAS1]
MRTYTLLLIGGLAPAALAATIYVNSATGNDAWTGLCQVWDGAACGPKRSIYGGVSAAAHGDTVELADGAYDYDGTPSPSITTNITLKSANGAAACAIEWWQIWVGFSASATIRDLTFHSVGTAVRCDTAGEVIIRNCVFRSRDHEAIISYASALTVEDCVFTELPEVWISSVSGDMTIRRCTFADNYTPFDFGVRATGLAAHSAIVEDCVFSGNVSNDALCVSLGGFGSEYVSGCEFTNNLSTFGGGDGVLTMSLSSGSAEIRDCLFIDNQQGAVLGAAGLFAVNNCSFVRNYTNGSGGAMRANAGKNGRIRVRNTLFAQNDALVQGGGVHAYTTGPEATIAFENSTFVENTAGQVVGGLRGLGNVSLVNCVLWGNRDHYGQIGGLRAQLDLCCGETDVSYSCIEGWNPANGVGNIAADPLFVPGHAEYHLSASSPCIHAGDPLTTTAGMTDIDGEPRVMDGRVDIGADEFTGEPFAFGDTNCDGYRDVLDINPLVLALLNPGAYASQFPECFLASADANDDGAVNVLDINTFVALLLGG